MTYLEYLKAKRRIKTLNRSIAQRERQGIWADYDELWSRQRERNALKAEIHWYEVFNRATLEYDIWAEN